MKWMFRKEWKIKRNSDGTSYTFLFVSCDAIENEMIIWIYCFVMDDAQM
jgi:hypothetical protein